MSKQINTYSKPSNLRITDLRLTDIEGAPKHCTLLKLYTNQDIVGYGELRDASSRTYALILKSRVVGENPCNVDKIFRRIKQFGGHSRQAAGVCAIEIALWDLAGKAYGVPVYQLLGGRFRDKIRMYCDTDLEFPHTGQDMGKALQERIDRGFHFLKMDLGINLLIHEPGTLSAPSGVIEAMEMASPKSLSHQKGSVDKSSQRGMAYEIFNTAHPFTGIRITEKGLGLLEQYVADVRSVVGYEIPLAIDHFGHVGVNDAIRFARRMEKYNLAWIEDLVPWQYTDQYVKLSQCTTTPICTGEDIYLEQNFRPLLESHAVSIIHPDILTSGGVLETKKIGDLAQDHGIAMAIHHAASPVSCLAAVHCAAATENFIVMEHHSADVSWWDDIVTGIRKPIVQNGFINLPESPGLGIEATNDSVLEEHLHPDHPDLWGPTEEWNDEWANDRLWS